MRWNLISLRRGVRRRLPMAKSNRLLLEGLETRLVPAGIAALAKAFDSFVPGTVTHGDNSTHVTVPPGTRLNAAHSGGTTVASLVVDGYPSPVVVHSVHTFSVTAVDIDGNTVTDYLGTITFTSTDPQAILPDDYTFTPDDSGTHIFATVFEVVGVQSLTATDTESSITGTQDGIEVVDQRAYGASRSADALLSQSFILNVVLAPVARVQHLTGSVTGPSIPSRVPSDLSFATAAEEHQPSTLARPGTGGWAGATSPAALSLLLGDQGAELFRGTVVDNLILARLG